MRETGKSIAEVARDLGLNPGTLGNWVKKDLVERGEKSATQVTEAVTRLLVFTSSARVSWATSGDASGAVWLTLSLTSPEPGSAGDCEDR